MVACSPISEPAEGSFSVLTYNVHGLPSAITGDDTEARIGAIAPLLNAFDLVGLQEDFIDSNHIVLEENSTHSTQIRFNEVFDDSRFYGSGLAVFAPFAEEDRVHQHYGSCNGTLDAASDCLASKGFQAIRLILDAELSIDVYNPHLEAGGSPEDDEVRAGQVHQLISSLTTWSADRAVVFTGDFNLHADDPEDSSLLDELTGEAELRDSCIEVNCPEPNHIDRIFVRSGRAVELNPTDWTVEEDFNDEDGLALSDHPAISTSIDWVSLP